jgi:hypothetical protein
MNRSDSRSTELRVLLSAAEHHVLEEVGEAALAFLHLVTTSGADHGHVGDLPWCTGLDQVGLESVLQFDQAVVEREDALSLLRHGGPRQGEQERDSNRHSH